MDEECSSILSLVADRTGFNGREIIPTLISSLYRYLTWTLESVYHLSDYLYQPPPIEYLVSTTAPPWRSVLRGEGIRGGSKTHTNLFFPLLSLFWISPISFSVQSLSRLSLFQLHRTISTGPIVAESHPVDPSIDLLFLIVKNRPIYIHLYIYTYIRLIQLHHHEFPTSTINMVRLM